MVGEGDGTQDIGSTGLLDRQHALTAFRVGVAQKVAHVHMGFEPLGAIEGVIFLNRSASMVTDGLMRMMEQQLRTPEGLLQLVGEADKGTGWFIFGKAAKHRAVDGVELGGYKHGDCGNAVKRQGDRCRYHPLVVAVAA